MVKILIYDMGPVPLHVCSLVVLDKDLCSLQLDEFKECPDLHCILLGLSEAVKPCGRACEALLENAGLDI